MVRCPLRARDLVRREVDKLLERGVIQPSTSPWSSRYLLVAKKDGTERFCVDLRQLNAITVKDVYPLPRIDDILDSLHNCTHFTTLDLTMGFYHVPLSPRSRPKTAFQTFHGLWEFIRLPMGWCNAPSIFQRNIDIALAGLQWQQCIVYIDDVIIFSSSFEQHLAHINQILTRLSDVGAKLKLAKCHFARREVPFLGHIISA